MISPTKPSPAIMVYQLPQELIDTILHELCDDDESLRTCSLVARCWTPTSQRLLFRFISFPTARHTSKASHGEILQRFQSILSHSPHLAPYVRIIELDPSQGFPHETPVNFPSLRLEEVRLVDFEAAPLFPYEHRLCLPSLPIVTRLVIGPGAWYFGDVLPCLRIASQITELSLIDIIFEGYDACMGLVRLPQYGMRLEKLKIERGFYGLLGDLAAMPGVDLSELQEVEILLGIRNAQTSMRWGDRFPVGAIQEVLSGIRKDRLERLSLDVFLNEPLGNFINLTTLRSFSLHIRWCIARPNPRLWLDWLNASLEGIQTPCLLESLHLHVTTYSDDSVQNFRDEWNTLDKLLARDVMANLKEVSVEQEWRDAGEYGGDIERNDWTDGLTLPLWTIAQAARSCVTYPLRA